MNRRLPIRMRGRCTVAAILLACAAAGCGPAASLGEPPSAAEPAAKKIGVLIVSHGSRSDAWRKMLLDVEEAVRGEILADGRVAGVRSAFMEYTEPSIATQLKEFDREGYSDVVLVPLLLTVSSHSFDDIPAIVGLKDDRQTLDALRLEGIEVYKPRARVTIAPLLDFPVLLEKNVVRRVRRMSERPAEEGVVLVAYGCEEYQDEWRRLLDRVARALERDADIGCVRHAWCGHIVRYSSEPTERAIRDVLAERSRAIVVPVLVAVDATFQGKIIGGAVEKADGGGRTIYRHDAILPDDDVHRWIVDISRKLTAQLADRRASPPPQ